MGKRNLSLTKKSTRRAVLVDGILLALKSEKIFHTLNYRKKSEAFVKNYMHRPLLDALKELHRLLAPNVSEGRLAEKAQESLYWESDVTKTINNTRFLGVQHYDFVVYLFIDISRDKKVRESLRDDRNRAFVDSLWAHYNVRFDVV